MRCLCCNKSYRQATNTLPLDYCSQECVDTMVEASSRLLIADLKADNKNLKAQLDELKADMECKGLSESYADLKAQLDIKERCICTTEKRVAELEAQLNAANAVIKKWRAKAENERNNWYNDSASIDDVCDDIEEALEQARAE